MEWAVPEKPGVIRSCLFRRDFLLPLHLPQPMKEETVDIAGTSSIPLSQSIHCRLALLAAVMAMLTSRINLLPTSRTLASGVPYAPKLAFVLPPASHGHAGRADPPAKFVGRSDGVMSMSRING